MIFMCIGLTLKSRGSSTNLNHNCKNKIIDIEVLIWGERVQIVKKKEIQSKQKFRRGRGMISSRKEGGGDIFKISKKFKMLILFQCYLKDRQLLIRGVWEWLH